MKNFVFNIIFLFIVIIFSMIGLIGIKWGFQGKNQIQHSFHPDETPNIEAALSVIKSGKFLYPGEWAFMPGTMQHYNFFLSAILIYFIGIFITNSKFHSFIYSKKRYLFLSLSGLFAGFATATKYNSLFVVVSFFTLIILNRKFHYKNFLTKESRSIYNRPGVGHWTINYLTWIGRYGLGLLIVIAIPFLIFYGIISNNKYHKMYIVTFLSYYIIITMSSGRFFRYLVPLSPFIVFLIVDLIFHFYQISKKRKFRKYYLFPCLFKGWYKELKFVENNFILIKKLETERRPLFFKFKKWIPPEDILYFYQTVKIYSKK